MKSRPSTVRILRGACAAFLLFLLMCAVAPTGFTQDPSLGIKPANLDVPYWGDKEAMEKLAKAPYGFINDIATQQDGDTLTVSVSASCRPVYQEFRLDNPPRLVVDFLNFDNRAPSYTYAVGTSGIRQMRIAQFQGAEPRIARLVFDLNQGFNNFEITTNTEGMRLTFQATPDAPAPASAPTVAATPLPPPPQKSAPALEPAAVKAVVDVPTSTTQAAVVSEPVKAVPKADPAPARVEPKPEPGAPVAEPPKPAPAGLASAAAQPSVKSAAVPEVPPAPAAPPISQNGYSGHPLTLDLVNFSLVDFFRLIAEEGGINIVVDPDVKGMASIKMTKAPWDQIFDVVLRNNGLEKQIDGNVVRIATKKTIQAEAKQIEDLKKAQLLASDVETRVRRLNYARAKTLMGVLKDQMSVRGTIVEDERSGSLVITDVPTALDRVMDLIDTLDMPEPQVEIEARIVSATRDFARDIGVQFGFVQGNLQRVTVGGPNTFGTIGGTRPSTTPTNTFIAGNPTTGRGASQSTTTESGGVSTGTSATNNPGNFNVNLPSRLPFGGAGLSVGNILDTFLLDAAITAGESKGQAKLISQPKLTTQNNNPGVITQGLRFPVQVIANNTVTVQFQNAALTLTVTPQITADGNIILDLKVENNTPDFNRQVLGIPSIRTSESMTRVLVADGGTTVIGGIIIDNETTQEDRVPGLASLPILGNLFKRNSVSHNSQEVLFFITPRVMK